MDRRVYPERGRPKAAPGTAAETISVSLTPPLAMRTRDIAQREHRKNSSIVAAALQLYTELPNDVRHIVDSWNGELRPEERNLLHGAI